MRASALFAGAAALVLAAAPGAQAQFFHRNPPPPQPNSQDPASMCAQMTSMPNPPMSYEACMQMAGSVQAVQTAGSNSNTAGARPGDDAMTCDQIKAEIVADGGFHLDKGKVTDAQAANQTLMGKTRQLQVEGTAMATRQSAENLAVGAASLTPAGGDMNDAMDAKHDAEQQQFNAHAQQVLNPATNRAMSANAGMMNDVASQMQANPRVARLMQLGGQKNCH